MANKLSTYLIILLIIASFFELKAQNSFFKSYGGNGNDYGENIISCVDSGYIAVGSTESFGYGLMDLFIMKLNNSGDVDWHKTFGGVGIDYGTDIIQTRDSGFIATGYSNSENMNYSIFLVKIDKNGNLLWTKRYGGDDWDFSYQIIESKVNTNQFYIVGQTYSFGNSNGNAFLLKINEIGDSLWMNTYEYFESGVFYDLIEDENGNLYALGNCSDSLNQTSLWISKMNPLGDTIWNFKHDSLNTFGNSIIRLEDRLFYCGKQNHINTSNEIESKFLLGSIDTNGQILFDTNYNHFSNYEKSCVKLIPKHDSNNYYLVSNISDTSANNKIFYSEINTVSSIYDTAYINGNGSDFVHGADTLLNENGIILIGTTEETNNGFTDILISKIQNNYWNNNFSNTLLVSINNKQKKCYNIYPNPTKGDIFFNGINSNIEIIISNSSGRIVDKSTIINNCYNADNLKSGMYFITIIKGDGERVKSSFMKL